MSKEKRGFGLFLIHLALAVYFVLLGLSMVVKGFPWSSSTISAAFSNSVLRLIFGILILVCGVFLFIRFFWNPGKVDNFIKTVVVIVWAVAAVIVFIKGGYDVFGLVKDVLVIGGLLSVKD